MIIEQDAYNILFISVLSAEEIVEKYENFLKKRDRLITLLNTLRPYEPIDENFYNDFEAHSLMIATDSFDEKIDENFRESLLLLNECLVQIRNNIEDDIEMFINSFLNIDEDDEIDNQIINFLENTSFSVTASINHQAIKENPKDMQLNIGYLIVKSISDTLGSMLRHPSMGEYYETFKQDFEFEEPT